MTSDVLDSTVKDANIDDARLFDGALDIVKKHLLVQKQFIWRNMCKIQSENEKLFYRLCHFGKVKSIECQR